MAGDVESLIMCNLIVMIIYYSPLSCTFMYFTLMGIMLSGNDVALAFMNKYFTQ